MNPNNAAPRRLFVVIGCHGNSTHPPCPNRGEKLTKGHGYAMDYFCKGDPKKKTIDGYVEWTSEMRKSGDFPTFCPLKVEPEASSIAEANPMLTAAADALREGKVTEALRILRNEVPDIFSKIQLALP